MLSMLCSTDCVYCTCPVSDVQENQKRLFSEVIQFNAADLQQGKGSGLGLYSEFSCFCVVHAYHFFLPPNHHYMY